MQNSTYEKLYTSGNWVFNTELFIYKISESHRKNNWNAY